MVEETAHYAKVAAYIGAAITIALGTFGPTMGQGMIGSKACESIGKYPESANKIQTTMILGLTATETSAIFALVIALLLVFRG